MVCVTSQQGKLTPSWHLIFYMMVTSNSYACVTEGLPLLSYCSLDLRALQSALFCDPKFSKLKITGNRCVLMIHVGNDLEIPINTDRLCYVKLFYPR